MLLARHATGRSEIIALRHAYSGRASWPLNITAQAPWRRIASSVPYIKHAHNALLLPLRLRARPIPRCDLRCAQDLEELIQTTTNGEVAAFMAEPIQGVGGFVTPPKEYFQEVLRIVRKYGGLFICDEVQTGFGRTGKDWCGIEHWGVEPDIMTFAKGIANGLPIGATIATPEVADSSQGALDLHLRRQPGELHAAALATIELIEDERSACATPTVWAGACATGSRRCRRSTRASATCGAWG